MLYTMTLDLFSILFGGVMALLPVYAIDILKVGAAGLGTMRMASALGAVMMMPLLLKYPPTGRPWRNLLLSIVGFGTSVIAFGLSHYYILSLLFLFAQGAFDSISIVIRGMLMQLLTPEEMRGRVAAVNSMFINSSAELGNVESGLVAGCLGTIPAVLFGGGLTLLIVLFTYLKTRKLIPLTLDELQEN